VNLDGVRRVADAILYEGYILYPYRASSAKNRSRWQFGVLMPPGYAETDASETSSVQAECVFERTGTASVEVIARFLQVQRRTAEQGAVWDEAVEHEVTAGAGGLTEFRVPGGEEDAEHAGARVVRRREPLTGTVEIRATPLPGPWQADRLTVRVRNTSASQPVPVRRDDALPTALVAVHMIITVSGGRFLSMTDPPEWAASAVDGCENAGCWPVLADDAGQVMLASPIILPDYPEVAPESPGELYDGTEIDEILTLRTLALSDTEKQQARATDPRAAALIDRVESMDGAALDRLHGTLRRERHWLDAPAIEAITVNGHRVARGSKVTLRPGVRRADAQDMFLAGRQASVEAVLFDVEDRPYLAVTLADDPDPELRHGRFLYFAPDEVEPHG
jgi:hypothetical protein